jgi:uncharacterized protein involved in type VI secretion and phage assembly
MKKPIQRKQPPKFFGKYRGTVLNNIDPLQIGRLQLQVPDVFGETPTNWAMPCLPMAGPQMGICAIPPVGAAIWVEFEQGDANYPVWVGGFWNSAAEVPAAALLGPSPDTGIVLQTLLQNGIHLSDQPGPGGGIVLKSTTGASVIINDTGIYLQNGKGASITLIGPAVSINADALTII